MKILFSLKQVQLNLSSILLDELIIYTKISATSTTFSQQIIYYKLLLVLI